MLPAGPMASPMLAVYTRAERNGTADAICTTSFAVHLKLKMEPIKYPLKKSKETWFQTDS